jgi:hypothetical protein
MSRVKFGDVVKDVKINIDRLNNPYEYYVAGDHMDSEDLTIHRKGCFTTDDVGPAFIRVFKPGQILYGSRRTYLKKIAVADFEGVCANTTFVFETKDPHAFEQRLLPFIMLSKDFTTWSIAKSKGSTNPYVLFSDLADFEFELPPLEEQKVLVDKLWAAYRLKEAYKKLLVATDEMVKSQFIEMYYNTHNKQTLESVCPIMNKGITPKYVESSSVLVINQACIHWDGQRLGNIKYHNEEIPVRKRILESGDVLLNATGNGTLGRCCVFICPSDNNTYINDGHVIALSTDRAVILPEVLNTYLSLNDTQAEIYRQYVTGSTNQVDIVFSDIKKMKVPVPSMDEQILFVEVLTQADKSKFGDFKSQFIEMFGNPVTNTKGWKTAKIKDVAPEMPSKEQLSGKIWLLNLDMIESNTGRIIEKVYEDVENALSVQSFDEGNVLFSKLRPYLNKVVIPDEPGMATTELVPLRPEPSKLHKVFLSHLLRGNQFVNYANDIAGGTKMPRMPLTELRNFDCILPPMDKQLEFVFIAEQVDKSKFELKQCIENIDKVIKSLING